MAKYVYGVLLASGKTISILDVPEEKGMRAGWVCICPSCGAVLTAKRGKNRAAHFAHAASYQRQGSGQGCLVESANETALHQMAKEIIAEELENGIGTIEVPPILCTRAEAIPDDIPQVIAQQLPPIYEHQTNPLVYTEVHVEQWCEGYRPDIIVETSDGKYLVEILVTHAVQADKKKMAKERNLPLLEINLKRFHDEPVEKDELRKYILSEPSCKKWIVRPHEKDVLSAGERYYASQPIVLDYRKKKEQRKVLADPNLYADVLQTRQGLTARRREELFSKISFCQKGVELPFFVNIPIPGEVIFWCDRRVWQSAIFDTQVFRRISKGASINIPNVFWNLKNHDGPFKWLPRINLDYALSCSKIDARGNPSDEILGVQVVRAYIECLAKLGFVSVTANSEWAKVQANGSLSAPNIEYATALMGAINGLGKRQFSPNVDVLLHSALAPYHEEKRRKAEAEAAERQKKGEEERIRRIEEVRQRKEKEEVESFLQADYDQNEHYVKSKSGVRYVFCVDCKQLRKDSEMVCIGIREFGVTDINKGYCRSCWKKRDA
jgi:hypothetical protein